MSCDSCAIKNLIYHYAHCLDGGDLEGVASLFLNGRIIAVSEDGSEFPIEGPEAVLALYRSFTRLYEDDGSPHTLHMTSNVLVDIAEGGLTATSKSYALVFQALQGFPLQPIIGVRYFDRFDKGEQQAWRFSERRIDTRLKGDLSRHLLRAME